jgi:hypothetical protein
MKKLSLLFTVVSLSMIMGLTSCKGSQNEKKEAAAEEEVEIIDYSALVDSELPSIEDFVKIVDVFQKGTSELLPTGTVWDNAEKEILKLLEPKGFAVERDANRVFFISASKNCKLAMKEENYIYSYSVDSVKPDGLAAACYFDSMGDMYVKGEILLADTCVYDALIEKIKASGYELTPDEFAESADEEKYMKDCYFFRCSREEKRISLHYDFMKAQGIF